VDNPIVFLDFDGVLNSDSWIYSHDTRGFDHVDPSRVHLVNDLLHRTDAHVVVSSAWRILHSLPSLRRGLASKGFRGRIIGVTDRSGPIRGCEIDRCLELHGRPPFVILDDNSDMGALLPFLVQTNPETGIMPADVDRAVTLIGRQRRGEMAAAHG
jgi:hypothetical protein